MGARLERKPFYTLEVGDLYRESNDVFQKVDADTGASYNITTKKTKFEHYVRGITEVVPVTPEWLEKRKLQMENQRVAYRERSIGMKKTLYGWE